MASATKWSSLVVVLPRKLRLFLQKDLGRNIERCRKSNFCQGVSRMTWTVPSRLMLLLPAIPTVQAFWGNTKTGTATSEPQAKYEVGVHEILAKADELYSTYETYKLYDYLRQYKDLKDPEILWRLARATCDKSKMVTEIPEKKALTCEAFEYAKEALEYDDKNFACQKWFAIMLNYKGEYEGTKERIANAFLIKEHFLKAIELNPNDATTMHSIGFWCFTFADLPWYQQKIAAVLFTTPPTSSYEEALKFFMGAEKIDPNFYSMNLLMIGKSLLRMGDKVEALKYLCRAREYTVRTPDDKKAHQEAIELLKSIGVESTE